MNDPSIDTLLYPADEVERRLAEDLRRDLGADALFFVCVVEAALEGPGLPRTNHQPAKAA